MTEPRHRVVIVGGGFGGMNCASGLKGYPVDVTLIDRRNFHLFQPLLYQVATGGLSPGNIASPLRSIFKRQPNVRTIWAEVSGFDMTEKVVLTTDGERLPFDSLVLAPGSTHSYFGHDDWEKIAPGLKTVEDATEIRQRVLAAFERAEREIDPMIQRRLLTFVIVGGGPTGVELAGAISELAHSTMARDFRRIDPKTTRIVICEGQTRVLPMFVESLSNKAARYLHDLGIELHLDCHVTHIDKDHIVYTPDAKNSPPVTIETETVIWAAGVKASPLGRLLAEALGEQLEIDRSGRVSVGDDCSIPNHPNLFIVGDLAKQHDKDGNQLAGLAPVAMQQGKYVAKRIQRRVRGKAEPGRFNYWDRGSMATIGRSKAVVDMYWIRFGGFFAWMAWLFIHIMYLAKFSNRVLVFIQWSFNFITRNRSARLITGEQADARIDNPGKLPKEEQNKRVESDEPHTVST